jgi:hypothetical protein
MIDLSSAAQGKLSNSLIAFVSREFQFYSKLRRIVPVPENLFTKNLFYVTLEPWRWAALAPTMACDVCVCVRGGATFWCGINRKANSPPPMPATLYPLQTPQISLSLGRCLLTGVRWVTYMGQQLGHLLVSCPVRHSVTPRFHLSHLPFLPF